MRMALRWGICSAGKISHDFVVGLKSLPETEHKVVAVGAGRSIESATKFAQTHSIEKAYGSYEELAKDPDVDVVYVGNLHIQHKKAALLMIDAGKPVLCEKPLTISSEDTAELIAAAKAKNVFLMEAVWMRFFPAVVELRKKIASGEIGEVKYVYANFGFSQQHWGARLTDLKMGGGAMLDIGVYPLQFITMVYGERPESVNTTGWLTSTGVDETASVTLKYSGDRVAQFTVSINMSMPNEAIVVGTKGSLKVPSPFWCSPRLETPTGVLEFPLPTPYLPTNFDNSVGLRYEAIEVRNCLKEEKKESDIMPLSQTQIVADLVQTALRQLGVQHPQ